MSEILEIFFHICFYLAHFAFTNPIIIILFFVYGFSYLSENFDDCIY